MKRNSSMMLPETQNQNSSPVTLIADKVCITYPVHGDVREHAFSEQDPRLVWSKRGKLKGVRTLTDVSFELKKGDRLAIIGRNGSGKTTLLQALGGILSPNSGRVISAGRVTSLININLGIQPEASGHHNITLRGLASGLSRKQIEEKRGEIADFSELGEFLDMPMETYSAGMRMRLTFAIATSFNPEILILDEWLSAGDVSFKRKATARMGEFVSRARILVLASHSRQLILENCDKALWLENGMVRSFGQTSDVLKSYEQNDVGPTAHNLPMVGSG